MKARLDEEPLFLILDGLHLDTNRRYWIERKEAYEDVCDTGADTGKVSIGVEIQLPVSHNALTDVEEYVQ